MSPSPPRVSPVLASTLHLRMSPLERCFSTKLLRMRADTVPFPDPGGPMMTARKILWRAILKRLLIELLREDDPCISHESPPATPLPSGCAAKSGLEQVSLPRNAQRKPRVGASSPAELNSPWTLTCVSLSSAEKQEEEEEEEEKERGGGRWWSREAARGDEHAATVSWPRTRREMSWNEPNFPAWSQLTV